MNSEMAYSFTRLTRAFCVLIHLLRRMSACNKSFFKTYYYSDFLVYEHRRHISFDIQICQPRNKRSHCFKCQLASGWHINNNG